MYSVQCSLEPHAFAELMLPMRLDQVKKMEDHISTGCHHPPVREFICHGEIAGTTPLLLACKYGHLDSVKRIVQGWGVDVQVSAVYLMKSVHFPPVGSGSMMKALSSSQQVMGTSISCGICSKEEQTSPQKQFLQLTLNTTG